MALALQELGMPARSWQGWQIPIYRSDAHGAARIEGIDGAGLIAGFDRNRRGRGLSGFQGLHASRTASPRSAAAAPTPARSRLQPRLKADRCDIYTDVDGVYTTDPRIVPRRGAWTRFRSRKCWKWPRSAPRCSRSARSSSPWCTTCATYVRSSFDDPCAMGDFLNPPGTLICDEDEIVEQQIVTGIAYLQGRGPDHAAARRPTGRASRPAIFGPLAEANINVDMIIQNVSETATTDITFTVPTADFEQGPDAVLENGASRDRLSVAAGRDRHVEGLGHRHRHEEPCRRRRHRLPGAGRKGHQHPRDHHLRDQVLDPDRRRLHRTCGPDFAFRLRSR
jgi:aspartate kinase